MCNSSGDEGVSGGSEFGRCLTVWGIVHRMSWEGHDVS